MLLQTRFDRQWKLGKIIIYKSHIKTEMLYHGNRKIQGDWCIDWLIRITMREYLDFKLQISVNKEKFASIWK